MQPFASKRLLAHLQIIGGVLGDIGWQSVDVAWGESGLELVQRQREIVALARGVEVSQSSFSNSSGLLEVGVSGAVERKTGLRGQFT